VRWRTVRELVRLLPQLAGLIARLAGDRRVSTRVKVLLGLAAIYVASPVDLIPDVIPGLGYLDDVIVVAIILDGLLNHVGRDIVREYWPGDLASLERAAAIAARVSAWIPNRWKTRVFGTAA
jgi:uncharacterized membrane protein YkvA (DUF1232 family)